MSEPIFIHSLFRSGSTYLFEVFRRAEDHYYCYQEPLHHELEKLNSNADTLLGIDLETQESLRHPNMKKPYFYESIKIQDSLKGLFHQDFSYKNFFVKKDDYEFKAQQIYFNALIENAPRRPVLQLCRSSGRIEALTDSFPGVHIHLWREPRNQWWSFNINSSFIALFQIIYSTNNIPKELNKLKPEITLENTGSSLFDKQLTAALSNQLSSKDSYKIFYGLWLYSFINLKRNTNHEINIDELSINFSYRSDTIKSLQAKNVHGINFNDCNSPFFILSEEESCFFRKIENEVHAVFIESGYSKDDIELAISKSKAIRELQGNQLEKDFQVDAIKLRNNFISQLDNTASIISTIKSDFENKLDQEIFLKNSAEEKYKQAEKELLSIYKSYSWRLTKPIRYFSKPIKQSTKILQENFTMLTEVNLKEVIIRQLVSLKLFLSRYPGVKNIILKIFSIHPGYKQRLKNLSVEIPEIPKEYRQLSPRGRLIYKQLKKPNKKQEIS